MQKSCTLSSIIGKVMVTDLSGDTDLDRDEDFLLSEDLFVEEEAFLSSFFSRTSRDLEDSVYPAVEALRGSCSSG